MPGERIILDPVEVALADRDELELHDEPFQVGEEGPDWGTAEIEGFMARRDVGEAMIDYRLPNRTVTIPLTLGAGGSFDLARQLLQAKVSRINEEGGWLKRILPSGKYVFLDIVKASLKYGGSSHQALVGGFDPNVELVLEALPEFYGDVIDLKTHEGTGSVAWVEQIDGNLPGRVDLEVNELASKDQLGLAWHFRCRNYSAASTAAWAYEAEALTLLDAASVVALLGASGGNAVRHNNLATAWTPVLSLRLTAGTYLTHVGVYDIWARVYTTSASAPYLRLLYDTGDLVSPQENVQTKIPGANSFFLVNLGQINIQSAVFGAQRWQGAIQARGASGGENVHIDKVWLQCADEGSGVLTAQPQFDIGLNGYTAIDRFLQAEGALTGKTVEIGGKNYTALSGSDTDDFTVIAASDVIRRTALSDTETLKGRAVGLALGLADMVAEVSFARSIAGTQGTSSGLMVKATNSENYIKAYYFDEFSLAGVVLEVVRGGVLKIFSSVLVAPRKTGVLRLAVVGDEIAVFLDGQRITFTTHSAFPTDPVSLMAAGGAYVWDGATKAVAVTREYDNFAVWVPDFDAVAFAGRNTRLASQGMYRLDAAGIAYGPVSYPGSDLPRIPVSGPEERPVEIALKGSRGNFADVPDSGLDKLSGQLAYRPCWSYVPE